MCRVARDKCPKGKNDRVRRGEGRGVAWRGGWPSRALSRATARAARGHLPARPSSWAARTRSTTAPMVVRFGARASLARCAPGIMYTDAAADAAFVWRAARMPGACVRRRTPSSSVARPLPATVVRHMQSACSPDDVRWYSRSGSSRRCASARRRHEYLRRKRVASARAISRDLD